MNVKRGVLSAATLFVVACVPQPRVQPPMVRPTPTPTPMAATPQAPDWRDRALAAGEWRYDGRGTAAFGAGIVSIACNRTAGSIRFGWTGLAAGTLTVRTTYGDVGRQAVPTATGLEIGLPVRDPLLDQIAYSRGRFALVAGGRELILPVQPEIARVIEDCR